MRLIIRMIKNKTKGFLRLTLSMCILFVLFVSPTPASFAANGDEPVDFKAHWAEETLTEWVKLGLLEGDSNGNYNPDRKITRAEFMALLNRMMNYTAKSGSIRKFKDVSPDKWYYDDVSKALAAGYITGTSVNTMSPEDPITREQAITIISRIKGIDPNGDTGILSKAADSRSITSWAKGPVAGAIREGLVTGSTGRINPKANTTRSEAIVLLDRVRTDTRIYCFAGAYGPESGTVTVRKVIIASPGVKLRNMVVIDELEIADAVGEEEATLDNVVVRGKIVAKGGDPKIIATAGGGGNKGNSGTSDGGTPAGGGGGPSGGGTPTGGGGGNDEEGGNSGGTPSGGGGDSGGNNNEDNNGGGNNGGGSGDNQNTPITVNITFINTIHATVNHNETYTLPAKVTVNLSDGKTAQLDVSWNPAVVSTAQCGVLSIEGVVTETAEIKNPQAIKANLILTVVPVLVSITITSPPSKQTYEVDESLDLTGLVVTGTYSDNTTKTEQVSMSNITGFGTDTEGEKSVAVMIGGKTASFIVTVVSAGSPVLPPQKTYYIRAGGAGTGDGSDWSNAMDKLPDVLERCATYYIASGEYPVYRFDDPEQGSEYITIKKATANDHGTDAGWENSYGTGTALFTGEKGPIFEFRTGYYIIDGQTGTADSGHGIKLRNPVNTEAYNGGNCMMIPNKMQVRYLTLRHIEMEDAGWAGSATDVPYKTRTVYAVGTTAHISFQHCYIHDSGQGWMEFVSPESDLLIEHCYFKNGGSGTSDYHSVGIWPRGEKENMNIHIRYNTFENFAAAGGTGYITIGWRGNADTPTYSSGYYIYGNVFKETSPLAGPSRAIGSNSANGGPFLSDVKIYNNTFYNMRNNSSNMTLANSGTNNSAANNIWYGCDKQSRFVNIESTNNILNDLPSDPFIDAAGGNFRLLHELPGGMVLVEPFDKDMDGAVRGADGEPDIGAFEYNQG